jgi:hypothetical protein
MQHFKLQKWRLLALVIASSPLDTTGFLSTWLSSRLAKAADPYSDYFDRCRRKRNVIDYDDAFVASETEAKEIVTKAKEFADVVEQWIAKNHSSLKV